MNETFDVGDIVESKLSKEWVMVLSYDSGKKTYTCRTKSFEIVEFHSFELVERKRQ